MNILIPKSVNSLLKASLEFKNHVTGESTTIPVKFDPHDTKGKPSPAKQEEKFTSDKPKKKDAASSSDNTASKPTHKKADAKWVSYFITAGFLALVYFALKDNVSLGFVSNQFV